MTTTLLVMVLSAKLAIGTVPPDVRSSRIHSAWNPARIPPPLSILMVIVVPWLLLMISLEVISKLKKERRERIWTMSIQTYKIPELRLVTVRFADIVSPVFTVKRNAVKNRS